MNFYVDSGGAILGVDPEKIYQGSANANTIRFVGAFASNVKVTVAFKLPTGVWTTPQLMTASTQLAGVVTSNGVQFNVWEYSIPALVTETFGTVNMQFYVYGDAGNGNGGLIATASSSFQVERGVPITLPDPTDDYETLLTQILSALSLIEGKLNFDDTPTIGSDNPVTSDGIAKALNTKASLQEDNTFEGTNRFSKKAYFNDGAYIYEMDYYFGGNRNNWHLTDAETKVIMNFWAPVESDRFDIELRRQTGTMALLSDLTPIEEEVAKKYDKTGGTIDGNVTVTGDLTVQGTTITENAETLDVKANVITTNSEGVPLINLSGLGIRTDATNVYGIMYDPQSDSVKLGLGSLDEDNNFTFNQGEGLPIAVRDDSAAFTDKHVIIWDAAGDKFVDGGKAFSDLPTLAGDNDFTGINRFIIPITIGTKAFPEISIGYTSMTWRTDANTFYTYSYPAKSGTFAFTSDIPTDYATQTALANTQRQVDGLYTLLEQKNEIYVQTATDTYTTRETAGGENIADGVQTPVKKITGSTVASENLISYEDLYNGKGYNNSSYTKNEDRSISISLATYDNIAYSDAFYLNTGEYTISADIKSDSDFLRFFGFRVCKIENINATPQPPGEVINTITSTNITNSYTRYSNTFTVSEAGYYAYNIQMSGDESHATAPLTFKDVQINKGSTAKPYMPYFSGLKNAFFKKIVSTGRNLLSFPYLDGTSLTNNGVTFTTNNDGSITVNGTPTDYVAYRLISDFRGIGEFILSGIPSSANLTFTFTAYNSAGDSIGTVNGLAGQSIQFNTANYIGYDHALLQIRRSQNNELINNVTVYPMLNYGSFALPYEPYTQSVLSLPEAVELTEYDTAYPETGEIQRQSNTLTFDGTEGWSFDDTAVSSWYLFIRNIGPNYGKSDTSIISNKLPTRNGGGDYGIYMAGRTNGHPNSVYIYFDKTVYPNFSTVEAWKAQLATWAKEGDPLTVTYKTAEVQSTEQADFSADSYIAWKNGSETIEQGDTDNSIYGAENTVEQDYYLLTAPEEVIKE